MKALPIFLIIVGSAFLFATLPPIWYDVVIGAFGLAAAVFLFYDLFVDPFQ